MSERKKRYLLSIRNKTLHGVQYSVSIDSSLIDIVDPAEHFYLVFILCCVPFRFVVNWLSSAIDKMYCMGM